MKRHGRSRKYLWVILAIVLLALPSTSGFAADKFPSKQITFVVPWAPGGRTDIVARLIAPIYEKILGQPVVVVNKPGATGYVGLKSVAMARPDGYTLGIASTTFILSQYTGESKIRWEEFKWIGQFYSTAYGIWVNSESPWKTIEELIDYARKNPGKLKHGNSGHGALQHLLAEGLSKDIGIKMTQISYKGDGPMTVALGSKEVDVVTAPLVSARALMEAGMIRALAMASDKRSPNLPDVPTLKERGINFTGEVFEGLGAPKDTPGETIAILENALEKARKDPGLGEALKKLDVVLEFRNHKDYTAYIDQQDKRYHELLKVVGLIK